MKMKNKFNMTNLAQNFKKRYNVKQIKKDLKEAAGEELVSDLDDDEEEITGGPVGSTDGAENNPLMNLFKGKAGQANQPRKPLKSRVVVQEDNSN